MPEAVQRKFGTDLLDVQYGETPLDAIPLRHFGGARVWEIVEDYDRNTFRAVYTAAFAVGIYVLHVFQKKAKHGIATPRRDLDLVRSRFELVRRHALALERQSGGGHEQTE